MKRGRSAHESAALCSGTVINTGQPGAIRRGSSRSLRDNAATKRRQPRARAASGPVGSISGVAVAFHGSGATDGHSPVTESASTQRIRDGWRSASARATNPPNPMPNTPARRMENVSRIATASSTHRSR